MNHEEYEEICSTLPDLARAIEAKLRQILTAGEWVDE